MTTLRELRSFVRNLLYDETEWTDSLLNSWINDAIRDYSNNFPLRIDDDISCVTDQREYSLSTSTFVGLISVLLVEYPKDEDPPRYLERRPVTSQQFIDYPVYDLLDLPPRVLVLGEAPTTGEQITIDYQALHPELTADTDTCSFPDYHFEAIKLYTQWQAIKKLELAETKDPTGTTLLTMFGINSVRAERLYRYKIDEYLEKSAAGGYAGPWVMDGFDRVY